MDIAIIACIQAITVTVIAGLFGKSDKRQKKECEKTEKRAKIRAKEGLLSMKMMCASVDLGAATAIAIKNQHCNGEVTVALEKAKIAQREYYDFVNQIANEQITDI